MKKYDHFICYDARSVTEELEKYGIIPEQIISITSKVEVITADIPKYQYTNYVDIDVKNIYVVFYWYEE